METENCQFSSRKQFEQLFTTYYVELVVYLCKYVNDIPVAEDIVQEMFCDLWDKRRTYRIHTNIRAFLFRSARNAAMNYLVRVKRLTVELTRELENEMSDPVEEGVIERDRKLYALIEGLPEKRREIFKMCFFDGLRYQEVANRLNISVNTVKTQMGRALAELRDAADELILFIILKKIEKKRS